MSPEEKDAPNHVYWAVGMGERGGKDAVVLVVGNTALHMTPNDARYIAASLDNAADRMDPPPDDQPEF